MSGDRPSTSQTLCADRVCANHEEESNCSACDTTQGRGRAVRDEANHEVQERAGGRRDDTGTGKTHLLVKHVRHKDAENDIHSVMVAL